MNRILIGEGGRRELRAGVPARRRAAQGKGLSRRTSQRLALVAPSVGAILRLRGALVRDIIARKHRVLCIAPDTEAEDIAALVALGAEFRAMAYDTPGVRYFNDRRVLKALRRIFAEWKPHAVMGFSPRPLIYAALAARRERVPHIVSLCNELPGSVANRIDGQQGPSPRAFRRALSASHGVAFHNRDDPRWLIDDGFLQNSKSVRVVAGAGVDLKAIRELPLPPFKDGLVFLMVARLEASKGVFDFVRAARILAGRSAGARFALAGPAVEGGMRPQDLALANARLTYLGPNVDMERELAQAHVYVFPAHGEGLPPSILQAMAAGRPIITSDTPGCRDTVDEKVNGCLVPPGDVGALAAAMESFLKRPDLIPAMARASRAKAERRFNQKDVNRALISFLELA